MTSDGKGVVSEGGPARWRDMSIVPCARHTPSALSSRCPRKSWKWAGTGRYGQSCRGRSVSRELPLTCTNRDAAARVGTAESGVQAPLRDDRICGRRSMPPSTIPTLPSAELRWSRGVRRGRRAALGALAALTAPPVSSAFAQQGIAVVVFDRESGGVEPELHSQPYEFAIDPQAARCTAWPNRVRVRYRVDVWVEVDDVARRLRRKPGARVYRHLYPTDSVDVIAITNR